MHARSEDSYKKFMGPAMVDKAIRTLDGIVRGVGLDGKVDARELGLLREWRREHAPLAARHPLNELLPVVEEALADGVLDDEEQQDILWLCERLSEGNEYFCAVTADMQSLQGMVAGIVADGIVKEIELRQLREWMNAHEHLKGCWPYDELDSLIMAVLPDGVIDANEHEALLAFFSNFKKSDRHKIADMPLVQHDALVFGVCAACPEIEFQGRMFCFTGKSERATRDTFIQTVANLGGRASRGMTRSVNYLIVGADGNPCWAYACYGRKVEAAVKLRKEGAPLLIVHENDFWDSVMDAG